MIRCFLKIIPFLIGTCVIVTFLFVDDPLQVSNPSPNKKSSSLLLRSTSSKKLQQEELTIATSSSSSNTIATTETTETTTAAEAVTLDNHNKQKQYYWNSSKCVVIGLAVGYTINVYKRFVGSLRATGYDGYIILGIEPNPPIEIKEYLISKNVIMKHVQILKPEQCTYNANANNNNYNHDDSDYNTTATTMSYINQKCTNIYPQYKILWGRFPLSRDWLIECIDCTDGVMLIDVRDVYFQSNPFTYKPELFQNDLMLFEEIKDLRLYQDIPVQSQNQQQQYYEHSANYYFFSHPVLECRGFQLTKNNPMLNAGSTMGSRDGIIKYVNTMISEFDHWLSKPNKCRFDISNDDQSIHDYLYYFGMFNRTINNNNLNNNNENMNQQGGKEKEEEENVISIQHRTGPIHIVGFQAARIPHEDIIGYNYNSNSNIISKWRTQININWKNWLDKKYNLIDSKTGYITNIDGTISPVVHQYDRFGSQFENFYLNRMVRIWNK